MSETLELLQYVLAGLVASWVFYGLTPYKEPQPFNLVVRALIYTAVIQFLAEFVITCAGEGWWAKSTKGSNGENNMAATPIFVSALSLLLGFFLAMAANNNWPHKYLARFPPQWKWTAWLWDITSQSTHENNLSYALETRKGEYVVLALKDGRRIYGWPDSLPNYSSEDFFLLTAYKWLPRLGDDAAAMNAANQNIHPKGAILIAAKDVDVVEFVPNEEFDADEKKTP